MGAYDGYKYAKKKGYKGWKMYASIAGGAALGAVNPFKIFKMAKSGYKAYKAVKYTKKARNVYKKTKRVVKVKAKPKATVVAKKQVKSKAKVSKAKKSTRVVKKQTKSVSTRSNRSFATPKTISKYNSLEKKSDINFTLGKSSTVRKVSYSNISGHALKKHFTGNGEDSLKVLDPDGTTDKWMSYINLLATTGEGTVKHVNGGELLEIMGKMPKTGGGELDIGVRLFRMTENSKWSLRTVLTRQHN